jgi:hypothetical protein
VTAAVLTAFVTAFVVYVAQGFVKRTDAPKAKDRPNTAATAKKQYTHEELEKLVLGLSRDEVRSKLGAPDWISENGNYWLYRNLVPGKPSANLWFQHGVVDLITYSG